MIIMNRTLKRAQDLAKDFGAGAAALGPSISTNDLIHIVIGMPMLIPIPAPMPHAYMIRIPTRMPIGIPSLTSLIPSPYLLQDSPPAAPRMPLRS